MNADEMQVLLTSARLDAQDARERADHWMERAIRAEAIINRLRERLEAEAQHSAYAAEIRACLFPAKKTKVEFHVNSVPATLPEHSGEVLRKL